jgi:tetratricopeptide (TPR) repeat protein
MGQFEIALAELNKVSLSASLEPPLKRDEIHFRMARIHLELGNDRKAGYELERVITMSPDNAEAHYLLGIIARDNEELQSSMEHLSNAVANEREFPRAYMELGKVSFQLNHFDKARRYLETSVEQDPDVEARFFLGLVLEKERSFTRAVEELKQGVEDERFAFAANVHLASIHLETGETEQAFAFFDRALAVGTENVHSLLEVKYRYAHHLVNAGMIERALALWREIVEVEPDFRDVKENLKVYGRIKTSEALTRFITCGKAEFVETGKALCRQLRVKVDKYSLGRDNFAEFTGAVASSGGERPCVLHLARWTVQAGDLPLRELLERMSEESATRGFFLTSSTFTEKALALSRTRPIELVERDALEKMLRKVYRGK